jgi:ribose 5-phosphate isomerase RpiB
VQSLEREGVKLEALPTCDGASWDWARQLAECIARGDCLGAVVFCADPGVVCCVANKIGAVRAISVLTSTQAARARTSIGANMLAVEMPGRTFFEVRQILKALSRTAAECPQKIADVLQELDGHAHR